MKLSNVYKFIKKVLIRRNLMQFTNIHSLYIDSNRSKINNINYLLNNYSELNKSEDLSSKEFQIFSQNGEDGIILHLLKELQIRQNKCIEIGAGGVSSNILNLNLNFGFESVFLDGDSKALNIQKENKNHLIHNFKNIGKSEYIVNMVIPETIQELNKQLRLEDFALCSLDIDGIDYYIFEKLLDYQIPIFVVEYNSLLGVEKKYSVPLVENFSRYEYHKSELVFGASLDALNYIAEQKNYSLVYCENNGVNAFFVNNKYINSEIKKIDPVVGFKENFKFKGMVESNFIDEISNLLIQVDKAQDNK
ncbi:MAG: hypothetical protein CMA27_05240 [Euryarchaeota archaeon]|nr:hypothetical protein [Euryarchaeota archaeon]|tara:strand:+ start:1185 stop:2102 length:918 start_codon:yes stop_codon:yes gene_type:complete